MPTYTFECFTCGHREDMSMPWSVYKENGGVFPCPVCEGKFKRAWSGFQVAPGIKTVTRVEDIWRKKGLVDPEDPEYARRNKERIKYMREQNKKKLERMIEKGEAVVGKRARVDTKDTDLSPTKKSDIDALPDVAHDKITIDKDGNVKPKD